MSPKNTGVGRYVNDLMSMKSVHREVYTLLRKVDNANLDYFGDIIRGAEIPALPSNWYFQNNFPKLAYRKFQKEINRSLDKYQSLFHYSDCFQARFTPLERSLVTVHDVFVASEKYVKKYNYKMNRFNFKNLKEFLRMRNLIVDSNFVRDDIVELGYEFNPKVVHLSYGKHMRKMSDKNAIRKKYNLPEDKILVMSVSSNDPRKNLRTVVNTMENLNKENYSLIRVGPPLPGAHNFNNLSNEALNELYNAADVLLFPSLDEGFGYPLVEAMSIGLPIVASDIAVIREVCSNSALLVDVDSKVFSRGIEEAIERREELSKMGLSRSVNFSPEKFQNNMQNIYDEVYSQLEL